MRGLYLTRFGKVVRDGACDRNSESLPPEWLLFDVLVPEKKKISEAIIDTQYICKVFLFSRYSPLLRGGVVGTISFIHSLMDSQFKRLIVHKILRSCGPLHIPLSRLYL